MPDEIREEDAESLRRSQTAGRGRHIVHARHDRQHGIEPAPERKRKRKTTWESFLHSLWDVLAATDFTTVEVRTTSGLVTFYLLFVVDLRQHVWLLAPSCGGVLIHGESCSPLHRALRAPSVCAWALS